MSQDKSIMSFKKRLTRFYEKHKPDKVGDVNELSKKYSNQEKELFRKLTFKYGPEPKMSDAEKKAIRDRLNKPIEKKEKRNISTNLWSNLRDRNGTKITDNDGNFGDDINQILAKFDEIGAKNITNDLLNLI